MKWPCSGVHEHAPPSLASTMVFLSCVSPTKKLLSGCCAPPYTPPPACAWLSAIVVLRA